MVVAKCGKTQYLSSTNAIGFLPSVPTKFGSDDGTAIPLIVYTPVAPLEASTMVLYQASAAVCVFL